VRDSGWLPYTDREHRPCADAACACSSAYRRVRQVEEKTTLGGSRPQLRTFFPLSSMGEQGG
jgi:hypothetical protein